MAREELDSGLRCIIEIVAARSSRHEYVTKTVPNPLLRLRSRRFVRGKVGTVCTEPDGGKDKIPDCPVAEKCAMRGKCSGSASVILRTMKGTRTLFLC